MDSTDYRNEDGELSPEERRLLEEGGAIDLRLEATFVEIRSKASLQEPDWVSFEKRLFNLLLVEKGETERKDPSALASNREHASGRPRFWWLVLGGLAACLLFVPLVWDLNQNLQTTKQSALQEAEEEPLSSGIPLARDEELEKESEADDMAAELVGVSADAFLYGEKSVDDIKWKPAKPAATPEGRLNAKAPPGDLPDAPADAPRPPSTTP